MSLNPPFSFTRQHRLADASQYKQVFETRKKWVVTCFLGYFRKNNLPNARLGIIVKKDRAKKAVTRNLIKRITREEFRAHHASLIGLDIVVVAQHAAVKATRKELHQQLEMLFNKCGPNL